MKTLESSIQNIIEIHAKNASTIDYDRTVAISAVAAVRNFIVSASENIELTQDNLKELIIDPLELLKHTYNDTDGVYTNGKGIIGSVIGDLWQRIE